jgi:hypothetical protein
VQDGIGKTCMDKTSENRAKSYRRDSPVMWFLAAQRPFICKGVYMCICLLVHVYMYTCINVCICMNVHLQMHVYVCIYVCAYVYVYIYLYICIYIYIYVYMVNVFSIDV